MQTLNEWQAVDRWLSKYSIRCTEAAKLELKMTVSEPRLRLEALVGARQKQAKYRLDLLKRHNNATITEEEWQCSS